MPTMVRGIRTTDGVSSSLIKRQVWEAIYNFKPYQTPVTQFLWASKRNKYSVGNPKFELQEDVLVPHSDVVTDALTGGAATESDVVVTNIGYFKAGDVIRNTTANENYLVTAVDTANSEIDISKVGSGNITATAANWTALIIGSSFAEASASAVALSTQGTFPFSYTQIHKKAVHMSGTQMATVNYGGSDWANQRVKSTEELKNDIERAFIFGIRHLTSTAGAYVRYSSGLLDTTSGAMGITDASQYVGDDVPTESYFFKTFCKNLFAKGSNEKTLLCGSDLLLGINEYSAVKQQTKVGEMEYGYDVNVILTPFGRLRLVWHPFLEGEYANWGIGVDRDDNLKYVFLSGNGVNRDVQYQENIQVDDEDERKDQYLAEIGMHLAGGSQGVHRVLKPGASA